MRADFDAVLVVNSNVTLTGAGALAVVAIVVAADRAAIMGSSYMLQYHQVCHSEDFDSSSCWDPIQSCWTRAC